MYSSDAFSKNIRCCQVGDLFYTFLIRRERNSVQEQEFSDRRLIYTLKRRSGEDTVSRTCENAVCSPDLFNRLCRTAERTGSIDNIVEQYTVLALNISDYIHNF